VPGVRQIPRFRETPVTGVFIARYAVPSRLSKSKTVLAHDILTVVFVVAFRMSETSAECNQPPVQIDRPFFQFFSRV
jgi:hypothetical protein